MDPGTENPKHSLAWPFNSHVGCEISLVGPIDII